MREHANLSAMMGFMRDHVAEHLEANRPGLCPAVAVKLLDAAATVGQRFGEHLGAASSTLGQTCTGLLRCAMGPVELGRDLEMWSGEPDPLGADIVHVSEDGRDRSCPAAWSGVAGPIGWRLCFPGGRVEMFDQKLVHAIVGGKDMERSSTELSVNLRLTRGHGSYSLARSS